MVNTEIVPLKRKPDPIVLQADVQAIQVPEGTFIDLAAGTSVVPVHELGGDFTVRDDIGKLFRIDGSDAAVLGKQVPAKAAAPSEFSDDAVTEALSQCYDPEIPVNIVELGLVYECVTQPLDNGDHVIHVKMTLTAPGCGMGQVLTDDVKRKVGAIPTVAKVNVDLTFDPPWAPHMMSEAARLHTGML